MAKRDISRADMVERLNNRLNLAIKELGLERVLIDKIRQGVDPASYLGVKIPSSYKKDVYKKLGQSLLTSDAAKSLNPEALHELAKNLSTNRFGAKPDMTPPKSIDSLQPPKENQPIDSKNEIAQNPSDNPAENPNENIRSGTNQKDDKKENNKEKPEEDKENEDEENQEEKPGEEGEISGKEDKNEKNENEVGSTEETQGQETQESIKKAQEETAKAQAVQKAGAEIVKKGTPAVASKVALPATIYIVAILLVVVLIIALVIGIAAFFQGKKSSEPVNPVENRGDIQVNLSITKEEELKKALEENIDLYIKKIENIKKNATGKNKAEIIMLCDEIIKKANELKTKGQAQDLSASLGDSEAAKIMAEKEVLKIEIYDLQKKLLKIYLSDASLLAKELLDKCNQKAIICEANAYNDLNSQYEKGHLPNGYILYPPLLDLLNNAANAGYKFNISVLSSGHNPGSYHEVGAGVDIYAIDDNGKTVELINYSKSPFSSDRPDVKLVNFLLSGSYDVSRDIIYENIDSGNVKISGNANFLPNIPPHADHIHIEFNKGR